MGNTISAKDASSMATDQMSSMREASGADQMLQSAESNKKVSQDGAQASIDSMDQKSQQTVDSADGRQDSQRPASPGAQAMIGASTSQQT